MKTKCANCDSNCIKGATLCHVCSRPSKNKKTTCDNCGNNCYLKEDQEIQLCSRCRGSRAKKERYQTDEEYREKSLTDRKRRYRDSMLV